MRYRGNLEEVWPTKWGGFGEGFHWIRYPQPNEVHILVNIVPFINTTCIFLIPTYCPAV